VADKRKSGLELVLDEGERLLLAVLADELIDATAQSPEHELFQLAPVVAKRLPLRLQQALMEMRQSENAAYALVSGVNVDDAAIGDTPARWGDGTACIRTRRYEAQLALLGSLLGELFGWDSQQNGSIVHDVLPMREYENVQINFASEEPIWWHTEDAFHPSRPDYVGLLCLRNPQRAATTVSCVNDWDISAAEFDLLFEERFRQNADHSHGGAKAAKPQALLMGPRSRPYVCVDPYYLEPSPDERVSQVLRDFYAIVDASLRHIVLEPGEVLIVDNFRAVHGRRPFHAAYDGRDRWLKRISVSRDLRHHWPAWTNGTRHVLGGDHS
jgi:Taurine catabolism dioxygenase TauD, TfdA family